MRSIFILLLGCLPCFAQLNVQQPMFATGNASPFTPAQLPGLKYWWSFEDLPLNLAVSNWVDRVSASVWTNNLDSAKTPTNTASGVFFNAAQNQYLTNGTAIIGSTNNTLWCVVNRVSTAGTQRLINQSSNPNHTIHVQSVNVLVYGFAPSSVNTWSGIGTGLCDFGIVTTNNANSGLFYNAINVTNTTSIGVLASTFAIERMGVRANLDQGWDGYVRDLLVFTNCLAQSDMANLHSWATNRYSYSP